MVLLGLRLCYLALTKIWPRWHFAPPAIPAVGMPLSSSCCPSVAIVQVVHGKKQRHFRQSKSCVVLLFSIKWYLVLLFLLRCRFLYLGPCRGGGPPNAGGLFATNGARRGEVRMVYYNSSSGGPSIVRVCVKQKNPHYRRHSYMISALSSLVRECALFRVLKSLKSASSRTIRGISRIEFCTGHIYPSTNEGVTTVVYATG